MGFFTERAMRYDYQVPDWYGYGPDYGEGEEEDDFYWSDELEEEEDDEEVQPDGQDSQPEGTEV